MNYHDEVCDFIYSINSLLFEYERNPITRGVLNRPLYRSYILQLTASGDLMIVNNDEILTTCRKFDWSKTATIMGKYIGLLKELEKEEKIKIDSELEES